MKRELVITAISIASDATTLRLWLINNDVSDDTRAAIEAAEGSLERARGLIAEALGRIYLEGKLC